MVHLAKKYSELWLQHELLLLGGILHVRPFPLGAGGTQRRGFKRLKVTAAFLRAPHTASPAIPLQPEVLGAFHEILSLIQ